MINTNTFEEVRIAGFGGQGIILAGKLLAQVAMEAGAEVTYMPSYGAEMRGGTANSMIVISDQPIASPIVTKPTSLITMNKASLEKFAPRVKPNGLLIMNSSLIDIETPEEMDSTVQILRIPADEIAVELGNKRVANMVALGAYLHIRHMFTTDAAIKGLPKVLAKRYHNTLDINNEALKRGALFAKQNFATASK